MITGKPPVVPVYQKRPLLEVVFSHCARGSILPHALAGARVLNVEIESRDDEDEEYLCDGPYFCEDSEKCLDVSDGDAVQYDLNCRADERDDQGEKKRGLAVEHGVGQLFIYPVDDFCGDGCEYADSESR